MRRKNRQVKLLLDIPADFEDEEDFMTALMERMDETGWQLHVDGEVVNIGRAELGDIQIEPEE